MHCHLSALAVLYCIDALHLTGLFFIKNTYYNYALCINRIDRTGAVEVDGRVAHCAHRRSWRNIVLIFHFSSLFLRHIFSISLCHPFSRGSALL